MNDFLGRIAARSRGTVELITPRMPSMFEAGAEGAQPAFSQRLELNHEVEEKLEAPDASDGTGTNRSPTPVTENRASEGLVEFAPDPTEAPTPEVHIERIRNRETASPTTGQRREPDGRGEAQEQNYTRSRAIDPKSPASTVKTNDEPLVPLRVEIATQSDRDEPDNRATPNNLPMKTEPPPSVKSRVKPRSAVAISAVAQAANRTNNERFDALAQPRPEETIVNVTIGKLEVRAVVPPPQAPREPARSAVMSLEDYLKDKRAGRR